MALVSFAGSTSTKSMTPGLSKTSTKSMTPEPGGSPTQSPKTPQMRRCAVAIIMQRRPSITQNTQPSSPKLNNKKTAAKQIGRSQSTPLKGCYLLAGRSSFHTPYNSLQSPEIIEEQKN